ncbi:hypothetical protein BFW01_g3638 [Lasiodiplodia theobromae]|uniref:Uncharacterized protein n=1 Tax=Lasiodiplodia theobromae TaxID=45133 RepID=A0A5N5D847_9PEZI|nr:uncharacterized protein LTHEOB_8657 [Lasiodiplodia theobromae]KAB2573879.1 hypothetical protein DBV05_g7456 [Lasiodiplodia theobromae]KAF4541261.1 hypothetical protein LTHEOB_8657 [Lasiodiplodia theobromae]KAF9632775.1 hypothetical protein BFW01_g3638 [Lasiodiplodia theobromae]
MSVTTTTNQTYYNTVNVLADYELHHSRSSPPTNAPVVAPPNANPNPSHQNPDDWPTDRRRIPAYRPVQPDLDLSTRRVYLNPAERIFVTVMFMGVWTNGTAAQVWRRTGGKLWNIQYPIGGEF